MGISFHLSMKKIYLFDMNYPRSNIQGMIYARPLDEDDSIFQAYQPVPVPFLNRFLFKEWRLVTFKSRSGEKLRKANISWQFEGFKGRYFVPTEDSIFDLAARYPKEDQVIFIRLSV